MNTSKKKYVATITTDHGLRFPVGTVEAYEPLTATEKIIAELRKRNLTEACKRFEASGKVEECQ